MTVLQKLLNQLGSSLSADGIFESKTETAVKSYQKKQGLTQDGICGPKTWGNLLAV
ncbi:MAG: peptidoglycan-binding protein [Lachnospiraceae bacterium]|nr:peptidoglycan-binding protein [Lachnospiraceae bacterium]